MYHKNILMSVVAALVSGVGFGAVAQEDEGSAGEEAVVSEEGSDEVGEEAAEGDGERGESAAEEEPEPEEEEPDLSEEEPELDDPFVPGMEEPVIEDDGDYYGEGPEEVELPDLRPYGKGEMGLSFMLGMGGMGDYFTLSIGASFEYYVVARLAPGLMIIYSATWGDYEYPQSLWTMPFLKFVLIRSNKFAPYIIAGAGRDFEWGGTDDPTKGYEAVSSWFGGPGGGAHIGIGAHVRLNLMIMAIYQRFDERVILAGDSDATRDRWYPFWNIGFSVGF